MLGKLSKNSEDSIYRLGAKLSIADATVAKAIKNLSEGLVTGISWSGKFCSGKDSLAQSVAQAVTPRASHLFFAQALKAETQQMIEIVRASESSLAAEKTISERMDVSPKHSSRIVELITSEPQTVSTLDRTPMTRALNQFVGTPVRRQGKYDDYWVDKWAAAAIHEFSKGNSIFSTDTRFENEAQISHLMGCLVIRLDITEQTQVNRILRRDGYFDWDTYVQTKDHPSEVSLDEYSGFDFRFSNDDPVVSESLLNLAKWPYLVLKSGKWELNTHSADVKRSDIHSDLQNWGLRPSDYMSLTQSAAGKTLDSIYNLNFAFAVAKVTETLKKALAA